MIPGNTVTATASPRQPFIIASTPNNDTRQHCYHYSIPSPTIVYCVNTKQWYQATLLPLQHPLANHCLLRQHQTMIPGNTVTATACPRQPFFIASTPNNDTRQHCYRYSTPSPTILYCTNTKQWYQATLLPLQHALANHCLLRQHQTMIPGNTVIATASPRQPFIIVSTPNKKKCWQHLKHFASSDKRYECVAKNWGHEKCEYSAVNALPYIAISDTISP